MRIRTLTYLLAFTLVTLSNLHAHDSLRAVKGVMDLRDYDFKSQGPVKLAGEFEFYWNQMLSPGLEGVTGEMTYITVPGSWYRLREDFPEVERFGFATYRLILLLPDQVDEVSLKIEDVYSASGYFLNGRAIDYLGFPGVNKYQTVIRFNRPLATGRVTSRQAELLIRVSNFENMSSGIVGGITLGLPEQMEKLRDKELNRGYFLMGAFLIIGIYFLGLFLIRSEQYRLYFSIICILMALRVAMILEVPFLSEVNLTGLALTRLDYLTIYFFAPFFTLMIHSLFPIEFPKLLFRIIVWGSAIFIAIVVVSPISLFSFTLPVFFVFFILMSMAYLYVMILACSRGRSHAYVFLIGLLILFAGAMNDLLNEIDVIGTAYVAHYAMFLYLLVYAYIFADKSNHLQRKAEKLALELSQVKDNLEDLVEERTTEIQSMSSLLERQKKKLESTNVDLVEAMNARNRLFAIIGHDVRAPIGYARQALEMILENPDMPEKERMELLRMIASSAGITYNLLDNLLVWGRSQTGKLKASPVKFQLKALVDESLELVNVGIQEKKLKTEVYVSEEHEVEADRDQLFIVIRNLLSNALKFTPAKGSIYISSKKQKGEIVLSIRDTGIGIPESIRSKLMDSSSHVSTDGTKGEKGSGLGLKICYELMQTNNGWIKLESQSGVGSTVLLGITAAKK